MGITSYNKGRRKEELRKENAKKEKAKIKAENKTTELKAAKKADK